MGVKGLWQLLNSTGNPIPLESLENKVLAIDISIWLNQVIKGYRDREGRPIHNAHLIGLFQRICKLLFYKIRPIFVFDGGVPQLKKQTLANRRLRKQAATGESVRANKQLLTNLLTEHIINSQQDTVKANEKLINSLQPEKKHQKDEEDLFALPSSSYLSESEDESDEWTQIREYQDAVFSNAYQNLDSINIQGEDFKSLPPEIRYTFLKDMKETRKSHRLATKRELPEVAEDFSSFQLKKVLKRRTLQNEIELVEKEMKSQSSGEVLSQFSNTDGANSSSVNEARRVASDELTHVILIDKNKSVEISKKSQKVIKEEEINRIIGHRHEISNRAKAIDQNVNFDHMEILDTIPRKKRRIAFEDGVRQNMSESSEDEIDDNLTADSNESSTKTLNEDQFDMNVESKISETPDVYEIEESSTAAIENFTADEGSKNETLYKKEDEFKVALSLRESVIKETKGVSEHPVLDLDISEAENVKETKDLKPEVLKNDTSSDDDFVEVKDETETKVNAFEEETNDITEDLESYKIEENNVLEAAPDDVKEIDHDAKIKPKYTAEDLKLKKANLEAQNVLLLEERGRQERIAASVTDNMSAECQDLLRLFGIPYVVGPMEAEAQCAKLDELSLTDGTISDDSDIWLFGGTKVYKNFFNQKKHVELFKFDNILSILGLDREKLINIAMLTGSDYTDGIEGVGPVTAMEILTEFKDNGIDTLKNFSNWWKKANEKKTPPGNKIRAKLKSLSLPDTFPSLAVYQAYLHPEVDDSNEKFSWSSPDLDQLRHFTFDKFGWTKVKADNLLLPVIKKLNSVETQKTLDSFLTFSLKKEKEMMPSKRLQQVLNKNKNYSPEKVKKTNKSKPSKVKPSPIPTKKLDLSSESNDEEEMIQQSTSKTKIKSFKDDELIGISKANTLLQPQGKKKCYRRNKSKVKLELAKSNYLSSDSSDE